MITFHNLKIDSKYYITTYDPGINDFKKLHVQILKHFKYNDFEYISFQVTESSKHILSVTGRNVVTVPVEWVKNIESLSCILTKKTIDDVIYNIDQFL